MKQQKAQSKLWGVLKLNKKLISTFIHFDVLLKKVLHFNYLFDSKLLFCHLPTSSLPVLRFAITTQPKVKFVTNVNVSSPTDLSGNTAFIKQVQKVASSIVIGWFGSMLFILIMIDK